MFVYPIYACQDMWQYNTRIQLSYLTMDLKKPIVGSFAAGWQCFFPKVNRAETKCSRPISLTSASLKCLERMVNHHIRDVRLANIPLHVNEHVYQSGNPLWPFTQICPRYRGSICLKTILSGYFLRYLWYFYHVSFDIILTVVQSHESWCFKTEISSRQYVSSSD